jgi:RNA polymerase sigma factor (sigma-70 family)
MTGPTVSPLPTGAPGASRPPRASSESERAVRRYLRPLLNFVRHRLRLHEALGDLEPGALRAEELVDAVFAEALARRGPQALAPSAYPWLRRLAREVLAAEVARARQRRRERSLFEPLRPGPRASPDEDVQPRRLIDLLPDPTAPVPDAVAEQEEFQQALARLLDQLPEAWREPFVLHVCDGYSVRRIAELEGITPAEVRRRIALAREFVRARLAEEYETRPEVVPSEAVLGALERVEPTAEQHARLRERVVAAAPREEARA